MDDKTYCANCGMILCCALQSGRFPSTKIYYKVIKYYLSYFFHKKQKKNIVIKNIIERFKFLEDLFLN